MEEGIDFRSSKFEYRLAQTV